MGLFKTPHKTAIPLNSYRFFPAIILQEFQPYNMSCCIQENKRKEGQPQENKTKKKDRMPKIGYKSKRSYFDIFCNKIQRTRKTKRIDSSLGRTTLSQAAHVGLPYGNFSTWEKAWRSQWPPQTKTSEDFDRKTWQMRQSHLRHLCWNFRKGDLTAQRIFLESLF